MSLLDQQEEFEDIWKSLQAEGEVAGDSRRRLSLKLIFTLSEKEELGFLFCRLWEVMTHSSSSIMKT